MLRNVRFTLLNASSDGSGVESNGFLVMLFMMFRLSSSLDACASSIWISYPFSISDSGN